MSGEFAPRAAASPPRSQAPSILIVLRSLEVGGSQRQAILLAGELRNAYGARVAIWTLEGGGPLASTLVRESIPWEDHPALIGRTGIRRLSALLALVRAIRRWHPDAILPFNDLPNKVCGAIWPWTGASVCVWNQRDEGREVTGRFLERRALRQVRVFTANSGQGARFLTGQFGIPESNIHIIPNGVRLAPPKQVRGKWRSKMGFTEQAIVVTMVANLHHYKDHQTLLEAWAQVKEHSAGDVHLVLAGRPGDTAGALREECRRRLLDASVHFIGLTDDVSGLLAASDISVFSSRLEGMPNGVLEGMAAGLPVVATRIPGIEEALGGDNPFLAPPGDASALAGALLTLLGDEGLRRQLGRQNEARVKAEFSVERLGQRTMAMLDPYLGRSLG